MFFSTGQEYVNWVPQGKRGPLMTAIKAKKLKTAQGIATSYILQTQIH